MNTVYFDRHVTDDVRRRELYDGQLYVYSPTEAGRELIALARELCEQAFAPYFPPEAQYDLNVEKYSEILKTLKPTFIHHPECKRIISKLLEDLGCDPELTFFDVPRLRTATAGDYLNSGLAYAFKPHRDTWYSPPMCQLNWWLPIYEIESDNGMAFYPQYWNRPIKNSSDEFNYQDWNLNGRKQAHSQGRVDNRRQSEALEPLELEPEVRLITEPGGIVAFSAAHLHGTVPNTTSRTRFSIDFRTVHLDDLRTNSGAPNLDSKCSGTTVRDYLRISDHQQVPEDVAHRIEVETMPKDASVIV